jgi:hypothetical protein
MVSEDKIEFLLIGLIFVLSVLLTLINVSSVSIVVPGLLILLALFYIKVCFSEKATIGIMTLFVIFNIFSLSKSEYVKIVSTVFLITVIVWVVLIAIKHSREYKSFEMVELSVGILLALYTLSYWEDMSKYGLPQEGVTLILPFAICFSIGTLMYSSNLWMRYSEGFKKVLTIILVSVLSQLLILTVSNVNI